MFSTGGDCSSGWERGLEMIIAVTMQVPELDGPMEVKFGRAPHLLLVDPETMEWESVPNPAAGSGGGAGVQAARLLAERGVGAVASGEFGPNAHAALTSAGIAMHRFPAETTGRMAVEEVARAGSETEGHPSGGQGGGADGGGSSGPTSGVGQALGAIAGGWLAGREASGRGGGGRGRGGRGRGAGGGEDEGRGGGRGRGAGKGGGGRSGGGRGRGSSGGGRGIGRAP